MKTINIFLSSPKKDVKVFTLIFRKGAPKTQEWSPFSAHAWECGSPSKSIFTTDIGLTEYGQSIHKSTTNFQEPLLFAQYQKNNLKYYIFY